MYLAEIKIKNFRNFREITVPLTRGLNVVVGENNIGKTNLIDAVRVALGPSSLAGPAPRLSERDLHLLESGEVATGPIRIDLLFKDLSEDEQAEFLDCLNYDANDPASSTASIHYEWSWSEKRKRWYHRRWGGLQKNTEAQVPEDNLQAVKVILLDALRDAVRELAPGRDSRLGRLLSAVADGEDRARIEEVFKNANSDLEGDEKLIRSVEDRISATLRGASKGLSQAAFVRASDTKFDRIVSGLRLLVQVGDAGGAAAALLGELRGNGLGYNNLLFIGTVLAELGSAEEATLPILLVEEPEAHLHPQLQTLLADFLGGGASPEDDTRPNAVQTIVTTHSPTIASHVPLGAVRVLHREVNGGPRCVPVDQCDLTATEMNKLRRMLDVTRATLLFSRGVILVEGVSEQLVLPSLARRIGIDLASHGVSVVSVAGVSFETIGKLFGPSRLRHRVAIVTDGDPEIEYPDPENPNWKEAAPKVDKNGVPIPSARTASLRAKFADNDIVEVYSSKVTLEHDLAAAGDQNPTCIYDAWAGLYDRGPRSLTREDVADAPRDEATLCLWRAICVADARHGKAELAQALVEELEARDEDGRLKRPDFEVPNYIKEAIHHVIQPPKDGPDEGTA